jgi:hypothetical protein
MLAPITPARLRHGFDDVIAFVTLQIGKRARVGVRYENGLRGGLNRSKHGALPHVREIDRYADLIHYLNGIAAKQSKACLFRLEASVTKGIPEVVGQLHNAKPEPAEKMQPIELIRNRPGVLHAHDDADPILRPGALEIGRGLDQQPGRIGPMHDAVPAGELGAGLREVSFKVAGRDVERVDSAGLQIGSIAITVIDESVNDERVMVQFQSIEHAVSGGDTITRQRQCGDSIPPKVCRPAMLIGRTEVSHTAPLVSVAERSAP